MGRRASGLKSFVEWRDRLRRFESSELSIDGFCQQEEIDRTQFAQWSQALRGGTLGEGGRSGEGPAFVPVTVRAHYIEVLLPGGGLVRLSSGIDRSLLLDVIRSVSAVLEESRS
jgi:hypothetical protein